jgi:hypothetical protein
MLPYKVSRRKFTEAETIAQRMTLERRRANTANLTEILQIIQNDWEFMSGDGCVPVQIALQLMDTSSLGRAHQADEFREMHKQLKRALKAIVNGLSLSQFSLPVK